MKIALPIGFDNKISEHFGHAEKFLVVELDDKKVVSSDYYASPMHQFGSYPMWLISKGVNVLICKGIGHKAVQILEAKGIKVIAGIDSDDPEKAVEKFINDELVNSNSFCSGGDACH